MPSLSDMVKRANEHATFVELAKRAVDPVTGTRASSGWLCKLANGGVTRIPDPEHLGALAAMLDIEYELLWDIAVEQFMPRDRRRPPVSDEESRRQLQAFSARAEMHLAKAAEAQAAADRVARILGTIEDRLKSA